MLMKNPGENGVLHHRLHTECETALAPEGIAVDLIRVSLRLHSLFLCEYSISFAPVEQNARKSNPEAGVPSSRRFCAK